VFSIIPHSYSNNIDYNQCALSTLPTRRSSDLSGSGAITTDALSLRMRRPGAMSPDGSSSPGSAKNSNETRRRRPYGKTHLEAQRSEEHTSELQSLRHLV